MWAEHGPGSEQVFSSTGHGQNGAAAVASQELIS